MEVITRYAATTLIETWAYLSEKSQMYTPLVQKQWETLVPLRAQVVHKATGSMRDLKRLLKPGQEQDRIVSLSALTSTSIR